MSDKMDIKDEVNAQEANDGETVQTDTVAEDDGKLKGGDKKRLKRAEADLADAKKALEAKEAELKEEQEKYLRMLAEYDNYRRRTTKEKESLYADAYTDAVKEILPLVDNLERAATSIPADEAETAVAKGIQMTLKSAAEALRKLGVTEVSYDTFDPNLHNAVMHVEDESLEEGKIIEIFQKGYCRDGKIIRYAMVKVAN